MDHFTRGEIEKIAWRILRDAGLTEPPIKSNDLIEHLRLHLDFYSLEDPSFLKKLTHNFNIKVNHLKKALEKSKLVAGWLPDAARIVIDRSLPARKQIFPTFHEITHSILPWHKEFFLGDTAQTLQHDYQNDLELEANYGASELMFCGPVFKKEITDHSVTIKTVKILQDRYQNTLTTTVRKLVRSQKEVSCFATISIPPWFESAQIPGALKSIEPSETFEKQFFPVMKEVLAGQINASIIQRSGGPLGEFAVTLADLNGDCYEFDCETFFNRYEVLTIGILRKKVDGLIEFTA